MAQTVAGEGDAADGQRSCGPGEERRRDLHRQGLIEVAIRLQRHYGMDYAQRYLADVNIPEPTIVRVLQGTRRAG